MKQPIRLVISNVATAPQSFVYVLYSGITDALFEHVKLLLSPRLVLPSSLVGDKSNGA